MTPSLHQICRLALDRGRLSHLDCALAFGPGLWSERQWRNKLGYLVRLGRLRALDRTAGRGYSGPCQYVPTPELVSDAASLPPLGAVQRAFDESVKVHRTRPLYAGRFLFIGSNCLAHWLELPRDGQELAALESAGGFYVGPFSDKQTTN